MTVREAYDDAVANLKAKGFDDDEARTCARLLIADLTETSHAHLLRADEKMPSEDSSIARWYDLIGELTSGKPLAYIRRQREFYGLTFICDNRALIPRPETELLVENAIERLRNCAAPLVADMGTGSGCIAVSVAHELPQCVVYASDLSHDALDLAKQNATRNTVQNRIEFLQGQSGEWAQPFVEAGFARQFNCVVTNPPYISKTDIEELPVQIKEHEPRLALDGGADGLDCYRQIARQCGELLTDDGFLLAELGAGQFDSVKLIFEKNDWEVAPPIFDLAGHERVLLATFNEPRA